MPRQEFVHAVDAALLQHEIARGGFDQHRQVAAGDHRMFTVLMFTPRIS